MFNDLGHLRLEDCFERVVSGRGVVTSEVLSGQTSQTFLVTLTYTADGKGSQLKLIITSGSFLGAWTSLGRCSPRATTTRSSSTRSPISWTVQLSTDLPRQALTSVGMGSA